uniref:Thioredoxin n=1 Tax=Ignisphaera aggregans TaxID=334771 RepID=A0A7C2ZNB5_9CREN
MSLEPNENNEIQEILDKLSQNIVSRMENRVNVNRCCRADVSRLGGVVIAKSYEEFINAVSMCRLAFVLITTTHCPYCYMFKPVFAKVAKLYGGKAVFVEVNADYMPEVAWSLNVFSTPTTVVLLDKRPVDAVVGYVPFNSFSDYVGEIINRVGCANT